MKRSSLDANILKQAKSLIETNPFFKHCNKKKIVIIKYIKSKVEIDSIISFKKPINCYLKLQKVLLTKLKQVIELEQRSLQEAWLFL